MNLHFFVMYMIRIMSETKLIYSLLQPDTFGTCVWKWSSLSLTPVCVEESVVNRAPNHQCVVVVGSWARPGPSLLKPESESASEEGIKKASSPMWCRRILMGTPSVRWLMFLV